MGIKLRGDVIKNSEMLKTLKLKVCGMRNAKNIEGLMDLKPDFMGFIFYPESPRYAQDLNEELMAKVPSSINGVGVFVNEEIHKILALSDKYNLTYAQLHGDETLSYAMELKTKGIKIIKVFRIKDSIPSAALRYVNIADYLLFDTYTTGYGGSGRHFDWNILKNYDIKVPFLLSGGVQIEDINEIKSMKLPMLAGLDVNSKFELEPGLKNLELVKELKNKL
ncbi:MAG: phosphoribosylanthranilate isomerase [Bacteroidota bacterium]